MIDGTKQYGKIKSPSEATIKASEEITDPISNALNREPQLNRRAWFQSLVPALGDGLVKILRESNNLQTEIHEALKEKTRQALAEDYSEGPAQITEDPLPPKP